MPLTPSMTIEQKIGQLMCCGWSEPDCYLKINPQARRLVAELQVGGLLLMGRNVQKRSSSNTPPSVDVARVQRMISDLQDWARAVGMPPLLIATDQEGGRVQRLRNTPFTRIPTGADVGAKNSPASTERLGWVIARELRAVGIHWDFAPVCDLRFSNTNEAIGDRSIGSDPKQVGALIAAETAGMIRGGVLPCLKHFPGQGATDVDSHINLPSLPVTLPQLMAREMVPFQQVIRAHPNPLSIMAAHILTPGVARADLPASLNPDLLTGLLRRRMGFDGLIITDDLEMEPIVERFGVGKAAVQAINAGADMVLVCHTINAQVEVRNALLASARSGALPSTRIDEALRRIQAAKSWALSRPSVPASAIGCPEHQAIVQAICPPQSK